MTNRKHFKTSMICSTSDYELTIRIHRELYMDKYERQQIEISKCVVKVSFLGKNITLKGREALKWYNKK